MSKFFIPKENISFDNLIITGEDVKHINKVLRMGVGDEITCCDGQGNDYNARISSVGPEIVCEILEKRKWIFWLGYRNIRLLILATL